MHLCWQDANTGAPRHEKTGANAQVKACWTGQSTTPEVLRIADNHLAFARAVGIDLLAGTIRDDALAVLHHFEYQYRVYAIRLFLLKGKRDERNVSDLDHVLLQIRQSRPAHAGPGPRWVGELLPEGCRVV